MLRILSFKCRHHQNWRI